MDIDAIVFIIIVAGAFVGSIAIIIWTFIKNNNQIKNYNPEELSPSELLVKKAEVISKHTEILKKGSYKNPSHDLVYCMVFKIENNKIEEYSVPVEIFEKYQPHNTGNLITINGCFFDFGDGTDL